MPLPDYLLTLVLAAGPLGDGKLPTTLSAPSIGQPSGGVRGVGAGMSKHASAPLAGAAVPPAQCKDPKTGKPASGKHAKCAPKTKPASAP